MDSKSGTPIENGNQDNQEIPKGSNPMAKTTTISTIAVQSGKTRLVIALLHVRCLYTLTHIYYVHTFTENYF